MKIPYSIVTSSSDRWHTEYVRGTITPACCSLMDDAAAKEWVELCWDSFGTVRLLLHVDDGSWEPERADVSINVCPWCAEEIELEEAT